ncbi:31278_t:CDS:2, partial [Racocetra persica]
MYNMNRVISSKQDTTARQVSIQAALNFLEIQKTSSSSPLSIRRVALNHGNAEQTLCDAVAKAQLEHENKILYKHVQRLEHPGTVSLASIMNYPFPQQCSIEKKSQTRPKTFKFRPLITAELIVKELEDRENTKQKKLKIQG